MSQSFFNIPGGYWNFRGSFKVGGILDVGTHCSLVRRQNGKWLLLDSYSLDSRARRQVAELTQDGKDIEAILNVHPFHTVHVKRMHELYPKAALYGTERHLARFPDLPWRKTRTEDEKLHEKFSADLEFSVPRGVEFIPEDENLHFSSVMVYHPASRTMHVDDTLNYLRLPSLVRAVGLGDSVAFHPTLAKVLEHRAGAADEFEAWARDLIKRWHKAENLCAAHTAAFLACDNKGPSLHDRWQKALEKVEGTLQAHRKKYGE